MYPRPFSYVRATSVDHALAALAEHGDEARILAGGASIIPLMKYRNASPAVLVDIGGLESELRYLRDGGEHVLVGAMARHADAQVADAAPGQPLIKQVADVIADQQVRNMGTVVGGICAVEPTGDWAPSLMALKGTVVARSTQGERIVDATELVTGPFSTSLRPDELVVEARFPVTGPRRGAVHEKLTVRVNAGVVNCSAAVQVAEDGTLADVGIALGAVERQPVRGRAAEDVLLGQLPEGAVLDEAAWAAVSELHPGTDARGDAEFRRAAAAALLKRAVRGAYRQATQKVSA